MEYHTSPLRSIVDFIDCETKHTSYYKDNRQDAKVVFAHELYRDYFLAIALSFQYESLCDKVYNYCVCKDILSMSIGKQGLKRLKRDLSEEITSLYHKVRWCAKSQDVEAPLFRGHFDSFFYKCVAHMFVESGSISLEKLDVLYKFIMAEHLKNTILSDPEDSHLFMFDELFHILSAYQSLTGSRSGYDLKYLSTFHYLSGYRGKKVARLIALYSASITVSLFIGIYTALGVGVIHPLTWFFPLLSLICTLIYLGVAFSIMRWKLHNFLNKKSELVAENYFETYYIKGRKRRKAGYYLINQVKRVVFPQGMRKLSTNTFVCKGQLMSIWLPSTIKEIKAMDMSVFNQIHYDGTMEQWDQVRLQNNMGLNTVYCSDGVVWLENKSRSAYQLEADDPSDSEIEAFITYLMIRNADLSREALIEQLVDLTNEGMLKYGNDSYTDHSVDLLCCALYEFKSASAQEFEELRNLLLQ